MAADVTGRGAGAGTPSPLISPAVIKAKRILRLFLSHFSAPFPCLCRILCWLFTLINRFGTIIAIYFSVFRKHQLLSALCSPLSTVIRQRCAPLWRRGQILLFIGAERLAKKKLFCFIALTIRYVKHYPARSCATG
jgi:hypothetical protein